MNQHSFRKVDKFVENMTFGISILFDTRLVQKYRAHKTPFGQLLGTSISQENLGACQLVKKFKRETLVLK